MGDTAEFQDYSLTINNLYKTDASGYGAHHEDYLKPDEVYVVVDATFESNIDAARWVSLYQDAEMYDAEGYAVETGALPELGGVPQGLLLPGSKLSGQEAYMAKREADLTLIYHPKESGGAPATFKLDSVSDVPERTDAPAAPATTQEKTTKPQLTVGDTATTSRGNKLTVTSYESPLPPSNTLQPAPSFEFSAIEVKACASPDLLGKVELNPMAFNLHMQDGSRIESDVSVKEPALPLVTLFPGRCVHGWVTFQTPASRFPKSVTYEGEFDPLRWAVRTVEVPSTVDSPSREEKTTGSGG